MSGIDCAVGQDLLGTGQSRVLKYTINSSGPFDKAHITQAIPPELWIDTFEVDRQIQRFGLGSVSSVEVQGVIDQERPSFCCEPVILHVTLKRRNTHAIAEPALSPEQQRRFNDSWTLSGHIPLHTKYPPINRAHTQVGSWSLRNLWIRGGHHEHTLPPARASIADNNVALQLNTTCTPRTNSPQQGVQFHIPRGHHAHTRLVLSVQSAFICVCVLIMLVALRPVQPRDRLKIGARTKFKDQ